MKPRFVNSCDDFAFERRAVAIAHASLEPILFVIAGDVENRAGKPGMRIFSSRIVGAGLRFDVVFDKLPITPKPSSSDVKRLSSSAPLISTP